MSQPSGRGPGKGPHRSRLDGIACSSAGSLRRCASFERKKSLACGPGATLWRRKIIFQKTGNITYNLQTRRLYNAMMRRFWPLSLMRERTCVKKKKHHFYPKGTHLVPRTLHCAKNFEEFEF